MLLCQMSGWVDFQLTLFSTFILLFNPSVGPFEMCLYLREFKIYLSLFLNAVIATFSAKLSKILKRHSLLRLIRA